MCIMRIIRIGSCQSTWVFERYQRQTTPFPENTHAGYTCARSAIQRTDPRRVAKPKTIA